MTFPTANLVTNSGCMKPLNNIFNVSDNEPYLTYITGLCG